MPDSGYEECLSTAGYGREGLICKSPNEATIIQKCNQRQIGQEDSGHEDSISSESGDSDIATTPRVMRQTSGRQPLPLYQQVLRQQARQGRQRTADRSPKTGKTGLNLWEVQQTLNRGDYVEGILHLSPGRSSSSFAIICAPVQIGRSDGHLRHHHRVP
eukprot:TRINITY_DN35110_c0_g1_i1.p1 TRINITY_DN35110_c0_g1~~TRINITY_DN35110_c0_g1_i1.p1  ORF type:complete len:178 (+),score=55.85 TRINITY_DN35110_c0_g1_i1:59-535(+)